MGTQTILSIFDRQLSDYATKLIDDFALETEAAHRLATTCHSETSALLNRTELVRRIEKSTCVPLEERRNFLEHSLAFNYACTPEVLERILGVAYAHTVTLCYTGFVFPAEGVLTPVSKQLNARSACKKCIHRLRQGDIRQLRNAFAHGNWYIQNKTLLYWSRPDCSRSQGGPQQDDMALDQHQMTQHDLLFWYTISRAVGYAVVMGLLAP